MSVREQARGRVWREGRGERTGTSWGKGKGERG